MYIKKGVKNYCLSCYTLPELLIHTLKQEYSETPNELNLTLRPRDHEIQ